MMSDDPVVAVARRFATLEEVTRWAAASGHSLVDVVTQDEFTHDVVLAVASAKFLVFDTT
jgi:hypothetical protein